MIDVPRLVGDHEVVAARVDSILEEHEVGDQQLVHAPDRLEGMEVVLAGLLLDVPRLAGEAGAERMDALASRFEQPRHRVLRQPVDLQAGMELAQLAGDGDVAPAMAEADRRREIEHLLRRRRCGSSAGLGAGIARRRSRKSLISALHLAG